MRRLLTTLALVVAMLAWAPQAQADDYTPDVPTECTLDAPTTLAGKRVVLEATVTANTNATVTGTARVSIAKGGAAAREVWSATARYDGSTLRLEGPRLPRGNYDASMTFTPDSELYGSCADSVGFRVRTGGEVGGESDHGDGAGDVGADGAGGAGSAGGLPNTGGPHLMLLLLGLGLVTAGGGVLTQARRTA